MKIMILDGKKMTSVWDAHEYIEKTMGFPDYYGKNLDALADCLGEYGANNTIILINLQEMREYLGEYAEKIIGVFKEMSEEEAAFNLIIHE